LKNIHFEREVIGTRE